MTFPTPFPGHGKPSPRPLAVRLEGRLADRVHPEELAVDGVGLAKLLQGKPADRNLQGGEMRNRAILVKHTARKEVQEFCTMVTCTYVRTLVGLIKYNSIKYWYVHS